MDLAHSLIALPRCPSSVTHHFSVTFITFSIGFILVCSHLELCMGCALEQGLLEWQLLLWVLMGI